MLLKPCLHGLFWLQPISYLHFVFTRICSLSRSWMKRTSWSFWKPAFGRPRHRCEDNIKMVNRKIGYEVMEGGIHLAQDRNKRRRGIFCIWRRTSRIYKRQSFFFSLAEQWHLWTMVRYHKRKPTFVRTNFDMQHRFKIWAQKFALFYSFEI
jgi:hypothetical protein